MDTGFVRPLNVIALGMGKLKICYTGVRLGEHFSKIEIYCYLSKCLIIEKIKYKKKKQIG